MDYQELISAIGEAAVALAEAYGKEAQANGCIPFATVHANGRLSIDFVDSLGSSSLGGMVRATVDVAHVGGSQVNKWKAVSAIFIWMGEVGSLAGKN